MEQMLKLAAMSSWTLLLPRTMEQMASPFKPAAPIFSEASIPAMDNTD
jgi:hypothetical protein